MSVLPEMGNTFGTEKKICHRELSMKLCLHAHRKKISHLLIAWILTVKEQRNVIKKNNLKKINATYNSLILIRLVQKDL